MLSLSFAFSQAPVYDTSDENPDLAVQVDYILENLDMSNVSSGLLLDRGFRMRDLSNLTVSSGPDTLNDFTDWAAVYSTLLTSDINGTQPLGQMSDWTIAADQLMNTGVIPILGIYANYHQFLEDSVLLYQRVIEVDGQYYDTWSGNENNDPYENKEAFAWSPKKTTVYDALSHTFRYDTPYYISNLNQTIASVQIDFDNGQGFQTLTSGGNKTVNWISFGTKVLTTKVTYTNSTVKISKVRFRLIDRYAGIASGSMAKYNKDRDDSLHFNHPDPSVYNAGLGVVIEYGCGHDKLIKPFIFVEAFNPAEFELTQLNYKSFYDKLYSYNVDPNGGYKLLTELQDNGYDIVYIDYDDGSADIRHNAKALAEAIKGINALKAANGSEEPNILVGESMGGLVARLALTYLEDDFAISNDPDDLHDVSYYVSLDSPHLGANVPRSVSLCVDDLYNYKYRGIYIGRLFDKLKVAESVLHSPAAKQMLISSADYLDHVAFQDHLTAQGMPTTTLQNIAIANGNATGQNQGFGTYSNLANVNMNSFNALTVITDASPFWSFMAGLGAATLFGTYGKIELDLNASPGTVNTFYQIYERKIFLKVLALFPSWSKKLVKIKNAIPFDNAPGGNYDLNAIETDKIKIIDPTGGTNHIYYTLPELVATWNPIIKLHIDKFCFIPTVSSLNISSAFFTPLSPISISSVESSGETGFQKLYVLDSSKYPTPVSAPSNEAHTSFTPSSMEPFRGLINPNYSLNQAPTIYGYTFNFGSAVVGNDMIETPDCISHSITISGLSSANGAIWVNRNARLENINDMSNPISDASHFKVELTKNCYNSSGRITIDELGSIVIGENQQQRAEIIVRDGSWIKMNDGFIEVRDGSKLIIENGGVLRLNGGLLRIQDGGEVIIKGGGKVIYEKDTQIELNGNNAVLALGGLTHIGDDATFTFTYQGAESGYIRMLEEGHVGQRFSAGLNADVKLKGANKDDLILYMEEGADFAEFVGTVPGETYSSQKFDQVIFKDGKIVMENQAIIILVNNSWFTRTTIESLDATHQPRGIKPMTSCYISSSTLNRMTIDAQLYYSGTGPLYIGSSTINNSQVNVQGYGYYLQSCDFNHSSIFSWATPMGNSILRSTFINAYRAVEDVSNSELFVYQSEFHDNGSGIVKMNGRVTAKCSQFEGNGIAINGLEASEVNISTLYNGGYNYFNNNALNIYLYNAYELQMEDGYNEFYDGTSMNIEGNLDQDMSLCSYPIKAYNNKWTPLTNTSVQYGDLNHPDMEEFQVVIGDPEGPMWAVNCPAKFSFGPVAPITTCGRYDDPKNPDPIIIIEGPKSNDSQNEFPLLTSPTYFSDTPFDYALRVAAYTTTVADTLYGDDLIAADKYYEFLFLAQMDSLPNDSVAAVMEKMRWSSLNNYKATIERLFADSVLLRSNNQISFDPTVQNYVTVLMAFTDSIKTAENYKQQFQLELWKAALLRTIGKKQKALQIMSNINYCDHDSIQRIILLEQIQNLEFEIARSQIDINTFLSDSVTFVLDSTIYEIPLESYIDTTGFGSYILSPNSILFSSCNTASARPFQPSLNDSGVNVVLYPNPTQNYVNISFLETYPDAQSILKLRIFELTGKEVFNAQLPPQNSRVDLPALANALYLYRLELNGKLVDQGKLSIIE